MIRLLTIILAFFMISSCDQKKVDDNTTRDLYIGGDFSVLKKLEDLGGTYKWNNQVVDALQLFSSNGYTWGRLRLFHTPNMEGPVCNSLSYTIALAKKIKAAGMKLLLNFHYSDTWADPGKQYKPAAWASLSLSALNDSVYQYSKRVIQAMKAADVLPDMVQIGNEVTPGMLWPEGRIYKTTGEDWASFCSLLKSGIRGVKEAYGTTKVPIMIHIDKGGDFGASEYFFRRIIQQGVEFDIIGLSYYPWWHGTLNDLKFNLSSLSSTFTQDIVIVEIAYYSNNWYPEPGGFVLNYKPFPPTEQGQYDYLRTLDTIAMSYPKVKGLFYWEPEALSMPAAGMFYLGRSLFSESGNALKGITAFKK